MSSYNYGDPVAIRQGAEIQFGTIHEIVTRQGEDGETTEFHVKAVNEDGSTIDLMINDDSDLFPLERRYGLDDFILGSRGVKRVNAMVKAREEEKERKAEAARPKADPGPALPTASGEEKKPEDIPF